MGLHLQGHPMPWRIRQEAPCRTSHVTVTAAWILSKATHKVEQREGSDRCRVWGRWPSPPRVANLESLTPGTHVEVGKEAPQGQRSGRHCGTHWGSPCAVVKGRWFPGGRGGHCNWFALQNQSRKADSRVPLSRRCGRHRAPLSVEKSREHTCSVSCRKTASRGLCPGSLCARTVGSAFG